MTGDDPKDKEFDVDVSTLSPEGLVDLIKQLEGSRYVKLRQKAQKELVSRLKEKGFTVRQIALLLVTNVYGVARKHAIAREWAEALGISRDEFLRLIGK